MDSSTLTSLISSIKLEASKLKQTLKTELKPNLLLSTFFPPNFPTSFPPLCPQETLHADISSSKQLIDQLIQDNKMLHEDIADFKLTLSLLVCKLKDTKRDLEVEQLKNARLTLLEQQITAEQSKKQSLLQQNLKLKDKYLSLITKIRESAFQLASEDREMIVQYERLRKENTRLKEMLAVSRIADLKPSEINSAILEEQDEEKTQKTTLQKYREIRAAQKRSKSFGGPAGRKNYLLVSPTTKAEANGNHWEDFFKKHEQKVKS
jgi:hypothetical protein